MKTSMVLDLRLVPSPRKLVVKLVFFKMSTSSLNYTNRHKLLSLFERMGKSSQLFLPQTSRVCLGIIGEGHFSVALKSRPSH